MKASWIPCKYCNGTGKSNSITGGCFFCCHPMIKDRKPGFRYEISQLEEDIEGPECFVKTLNN